MPPSSTLIVRSAFDGETLASIKKHTLNDAEEMLFKANKAFDERFDKGLNTPSRIKILTKLALLVEKESDVFARMIAQEGGKPLKDAQVEVARAVEGIHLAIKAIPKVLSGKEIAMNLNAASLNRQANTQIEPIGVVFAISAFNHPLNLIIHQIIPAIAVGCPVIIKPSLNTPLNCLRLVELLYKAGLASEQCQVLIADNEVAEKVACSDDINFFSFIGSAKIGWYLKSKLAPGVRCALEHGGVAPVIIDNTADLDKAVPALCKGAFYHAGQVCVSVQRIYAHESILEALTDRLIEATQALTVGDAQSIKTDVGPLIDHQQITRIDNWVKEALQEGASLVCGGKPLTESTYAPTILLNPNHASKVSTQEVFAPVVCIYSYQDHLSAIKQANALPFAFQASIFSQNLSFIQDCSQRLDASAVMINDHTAFRVDWMPFSGRRQSGYGIGGIENTMLDLVQTKLLVFNQA